MLSPVLQIQDFLQVAGFLTEKLPVTGGSVTTLDQI
jgi:hypothetical protein